MSAAFCCCCCFSLASFVRSCCAAAATRRETLKLNIFAHLGVRWRKWDASLFFYLFAIGERQMLLHVRLHSCHNSLALWVLTNHCSHLWVLHHCRMYSDMGLMILVDERLDWLTVDDVHVFGHRVTRLHVVTIFKRDKLLEHS
jgi:hypothetical protein